MDPSIATLLVSKASVPRDARWKDSGRWRVRDRGAASIWLECTWFDAALFAAGLSPLKYLSGEPRAISRTRTRTSLDSLASTLATTSPNRPNAPAIGTDPRLRRHGVQSRECARDAFKAQYELHARISNAAACLRAMLVLCSRGGSACGVDYLSVETRVRTPRARRAAR